MQIRQVIPPDAIPSIDDPTFEPDYPGREEDTVIVVRTEDSARAYPLRYLHHHEIVNDDLAVDPAHSDPVAVTWCPLCGSAVVYDRGVDDKVLEFGVSGKLADDDLVMYDRQTESEWKQSSGICIAGPLEGTELTARAGHLMPYSTFNDRFPDGLVLAPPGGRSEAASEDDTPARIDYDDAPYERYFEMDGFGLDAHRGGDSGREWNRGDELTPKTVVLGVERDETAVGFPLPRVQTAGGIVQTTVGDTDVLVVADETIGIHAYEDPGYEFRWDGDMLGGDGTTWDPATGRAADGRELDVVPSRRLFAFAWQDDHGADAFYE